MIGPRAVLTTTAPRRQLGAVGQIGVVEDDAKAEVAGAQRHRGADPAEPDNAKIL
jgi:hypothetical protein